MSRERDKVRRLAGTLYRARYPEAEISFEKADPATKDGWLRVARKAWDVLMRGPAGAKSGPQTQRTRTHA